MEMACCSEGEMGNTYRDLSGIFVGRLDETEGRLQSI
jgi:hypothetical protein